MKELDEAGMEKSLREKLGSYGRHPSDKVWENIQQRVAQHQKPAPKNKPWLLPLLFMGALLLLLTGNLLPRIFENTSAPLSHLTQPEVRNIEEGKDTNQALENKGQPVTENLLIEKSSIDAATGKNTGGTDQTKGTPVINSRIENYNNTNHNTKSAAIKNKPVAAEKGAEILPVIVGNQFPDQQKETVQSVVEKPVLESKESGKAEFLVGQPSANQEEKLPPALRNVITLETQLQQNLVAFSPENDDSRNQVITSIKREKQELAKLQQRADSMLLALGDYVPESSEIAKTDSIVIPKIKSRWSAALSFAPERNFLSLQAPAADTLMEKRSNHETGSSGFNASVLVDYRLTDKLSIASGFGYSSYSAELRLSNTETIITTTYDTITKISNVAYSGSQTVYSVHHDSIYQVTPILNGSGQVVDYDTAYFPMNDTTFFTNEYRDSVKTIEQTIKPLVTKKEATTYKVLKPTYHFVTLPVMLRYRLTPGARWWADVAFGAQLQLFRGGTQVVTEDGKTYRTEKIKASEGPFRQFNMALIGNLAVNYGLTEKLSVSLAPALRYQVQSVYKRETGLKQKPVATGLQFGLRYNF